MWGVDPGRVGRWWVDEVRDGSKEGARVKRKKDEEERKKKGKKGKEGKREKVDVVGRWLEEGKEVKVEGEQAEGMRRRFLEAWRGSGTGRRRKRKEEEEKTEEAVGKLDDLADCLLQGVAWLRWEENRRKMLDEGVEALLVK